MSKILIIGIDSFTGYHLSSLLIKCGYTVYGTSMYENNKNIYKCDITKIDDIYTVLNNIKPDYIINLSGISFVGHNDDSEFYRVNTIGAINILNASLNLNIKKIILVSSATVYGNQNIHILDESLCPKPVNHYGASKYAMETIANEYFDKLPILIARPFNYTGIGQSNKFIIPKIVNHYKKKKKYIELGNIDIIREFNDIDFVCEIYKKLLECDTKGEVINIASNRGIKLIDIINSMNEIASYKIKISINQKFIRENEIKSLTGSNEKLYSIIGEIKQKNIKDTLKDIYND